MSGCCNMVRASQSMGKFFSRRSRRYSKRFRRGGLEKSQQYLLEGVRKESVVSKEILDIGCGVGSLHLTLLREGAANATGVDVSEGMIEEAKKISEEHQVQSRTLV